MGRQHHCLQTLRTPRGRFGVLLHVERLELKLHVCNVAWPQRGCTDVHPPWSSRAQL